MRKRQRFLYHWRARQEELENRREELKAEQVELVNRSEALTEACELVNQIALLTQEETVSFIDDLVSLALKTVYGDHYSFHVNSVTKRDMPHYEFKIRKHDLELDPAEGSAGGMLDVIGFALRVVLWSLSADRSEVLILDEPFRNVRSPDGTALPLCAEMVKTLSERLGVQILLVSHSPELAEQADRVFEVRQKKDASSVKMGLTG